MQVRIFIINLSLEGLVNSLELSVSNNCRSTGSTDRFRKTEIIYNTHKLRLTTAAGLGLYGLGGNVFRRTVGSLSAISIKIKMQRKITIIQISINSRTINKIMFFPL